MKKQREKIEKELYTKGYVTRNWALRNYISRLSAIIFDLRNEKKKFHTFYAKTKNGGQDYVYLIDNGKWTHKTITKVIEKIKEKIGKS